MSYRSLSTFLALALAATAVTGSALSAQQPAAPAPNSIHAALTADVTTLSDKFSGLARVMAGKYDWRPAQGIRSVGEVLNLIVTENNMLASLLSGTQQGRGGGMGRGPAITDAAALQDALKTSYAAVSKALSGLSADDLNAPVTLFGRNTTKQGAVLMLLIDQHEHLGQSIAYTRSNGVVPPWSK